MAGPAAPFLRHGVAGAGYAFIAWLLYATWTGEYGDGPLLAEPNEDLADLYSRHLPRRRVGAVLDPEGWVEPQLPTTPFGRTALLLVVLAAIEPVRRWLKEAAAREAAERALASAVAGNRSKRGSSASSRALSRASSLNRFSGLPGGGDDSPGKSSDASSDSPGKASLGSAYGGAFDVDDDDVPNPCSDPRCLRCAPSSHALELAKNAARVVMLHRRKDPSLAGVSDDVMSLARDSRAKIRARLNRGLQAPTVFRLPSLPAVPVHRRDGDNCDGGPLAVATRGLLKGVAMGKTCWCEKLWSDDTRTKLGDLAKLERAAEAIAAEVETASFARRGDGQFSPFDPTVRKGTGEWSAVYLWRNGVRDEVNCAAFPATMNALCSLDDAAFRNVSYEGLEEPGCAFASAYLSKLTPGTLITPHCGPCNARLRVHLALRVPKEDDSSRRVRGTGRRWTSGKELPGSVPESVGRRLDDEFEGRRSRRVRVLRVLLYPAYLCTAWPIVATFRAAAWILGRVGSLLGLGPPPLCSLTVARRVVRWEEGRCVLFDDSFVHSAEYREPERVPNDDPWDDLDDSPSKKRRDADRIVLVLDLWHPALGSGDRNAVRALYPGGMGTADKHEGAREKVDRFVDG